MLVIRTEIRKTLVRKAHSKDPDKLSDQGLHCLCRPFFSQQLVFKILEHFPKGAKHHYWHHIAPLLAPCLCGIILSKKFPWKAVQQVTQSLFDLEAN